MEIEKSYKEEENQQSKEIEDLKIRQKVKNKRKNFTTKEIRVVLNYYNKNNNIRGTAKFFNIPHSTLAVWVQRKDEYLFSNNYINKYRLKSGGRKADSAEYEEVLIEIIKEGRANDLAITSDEVIAKAIELIPAFSKKSYDALHHWFKRFRIGHSYYIRKVTKITQSLPKYFLENLRAFLYQSIKDSLDLITELNSNLIGNVDETPICLEPITNTTLEKIGEKTIKIRTFGKSKQRISCLLCILGNGFFLCYKLNF